jgi:hypothetical protein
MIARAVLITGALTLTLGAGCVADDASFYIKGMRMAGAKCVVPAPGGSDFVGTGALDVFAKVGYVAFAEVLNHYISSTGAQPGEPEKNLLQLRAFKIELDTTQVPGQYPASELNTTFHTSGTLSPAGGAMVVGMQIVTDKLAGILATTMPQGVTAMLGTKVKAVAMHAGTEVESGEFLFPIELCNGCLVDFLKNKPCPTSTDTTEYKRNVCGRPQDAPVTCCLEPNSAVMKCLESK